MGPVRRETVDLSNFPDLVVIYLGMRVRKLSGIKPILGFGPRISRSVEARPDGLLLHEAVVYSLVPPRVGMRQVWRDLDSLERWTRSKPHADWWRQYLVGLMKVAPIRPARGHLFSARGRLHLSGEAAPRSAVAEEELYPQGE